MKREAIWAPAVGCAYALIVHFALVRESVLAQFTTVINVPPDAVSGDILASSTQVNVFNGGVFPSSRNLGAPAGTSANIELNVFGGRVGGLLKANRGATVNVFGGMIGNSFSANAGSIVNISGGEFASDFIANSGSIVNISGGTIGRSSRADAGSIVNI